jgi:hypothetical protein
MAETKFRDAVIDGEVISQLPTEERWFELIDVPFYEPYPTESDPEGTKKEKLVFPAKLGNGLMGNYYPNKTSARKVQKLTGSDDMSEWKGKKFSWGKVLDMLVAGVERKVPYITDFYPATQKV